MSQRTALLVATALTVFVVVMIVGVVWQLFQKATVETMGVQVAAPAQASTEPVGETQAVAGPTDAQIAQREAAFQQLIQQANQKLEAAYKQQQDLAKELAAEKKKPAPSVPAAVPQAPKYTVSAEQAASIALNAEKGAVLVKPAELVDFKGAVAYEVTLDRGVVYIDANSGQVIYDSALVIVVHDSGGGGGNNAGGGSPNVSAPKSGGGHENEHESHDKAESHPVENHPAEQHNSEGEHGGD